MPHSRFSSWLRRQTDFLASGRLTVWLLAILVLVLCVYLLVPQQDQVSARVFELWLERSGLAGQLCRALGLTDILHSLFFWVPYALMFANLLLCMIRRLRATRGLCRFPESPPQPSSTWVRREVEATGSGQQRIAGLLRSRGYRTLVAGESVYGLRGRFAIVGHWLFHLGLLALLIAGIFVATVPDPFRGMVGVGEGEAFELHVTPFLSSSRPVDSELPALRFHMDRIEASTEGGRVRRFEASLSTPEGERASIGVNRPYRKTPYQVMVHGFGYMAGWVIVNQRGRMIRGAWVKLAPFPLERSDSFSLGDDQSGVHARLYPDFEQEGEEARSRSHELRNPRFRARIVWRGEKVYSGLLDPEQRVRLQDGVEFFFLDEIRRYSLLDVIQERGHGTVFACLGIMTLGLVLRYVRIRKEILVRLDGETLQVFGRGEIFESLFAEEFGRLVDALSSANPRPEDRRGAG
jgi:hypothetical protein